MSYTPPGASDEDAYIAGLSAQDEVIYQEHQHILANVEQDLRAARNYASDGRYMEAIIKLKNAVQELSKLVKSG